MSHNQYQFFHNEIEGQNNQIYDYVPNFDSTGDFKRIKGIDVAIMSIRTLLLTPLGHYPFDPQFGSLLYQKLFEMSDDITIDEIKYEVEDRISQFEDRVIIKDVDVQFDASKKLTIVNVMIERDEITGTVSLSFEGNNQMFGIEDDITAGLI